MLAHVVGIPLGATGIGGHAVLHAVDQGRPILDAVGLFHARQETQGGLGAGFGLRT